MAYFWEYALGFSLIGIGILVGGLGSLAFIFSGLPWFYILLGVLVTQAINLGLSFVGGYVCGRALGKELNDMWRAY